MASFVGLYVSITSTDSDPNLQGTLTKINGFISSASSHGLQLSSNKGVVYRRVLGLPALDIQRFESLNAPLDISSNCIRDVEILEPDAQSRDWEELRLFMQHQADERSHHSNDNSFAAAVFDRQNNQQVLDDPSIMSVGRKPSPNQSLSTQMRQASLQRQVPPAELEGHVSSPHSAGKVRSKASSNKLSSSQRLFQKHQAVDAADQESTSSPEISRTTFQQPPARSGVASQPSRASVEIGPSGWRSTPLLAEDSDAFTTDFFDPENAEAEATAAQIRSKSRSSRNASREAAGGTSKNSATNDPTVGKFGKGHEPDYASRPPRARRTKRSEQQQKHRQRRQERGSFTTEWAPEGYSSVTADQSSNTKQPAITEEEGEFDFAANLSMFDKAAVFDQLQREDNIKAEDRLVGHNRADAGAAINQRGPDWTFGGTKIHPMQMVLSPSQDQRPRKNSSRTGLHSHVTSPSLEASGGVPSLSCLRYFNTDRICPSLSPDCLSNIRSLACSGTSGTGTFHTMDLLVERAGRETAAVILSVVLNPGGRRLGLANHNAKPIAVVLTGNHEKGARALATARFLREKGVRTVVVRQNVVFSCRNASTKEGLEPAYSDVYETQLLRYGGTSQIFNCGTDYSWQDILAYMRASLDAPAEIIIDGLVEGIISVPDVDTFTSTDGEELSWLLQSPQNNHPSSLSQILDWTNRSFARVIAIDLPSGIDMVSGKVNVRGGERYEVRAKVVVVGTGAPCTGLQSAMGVRAGDMAALRSMMAEDSSGVVEDEEALLAEQQLIGSAGDKGDEWRVYVADVGLSEAWRLYFSSSSAQVAGFEDKKNRRRNNNPIDFGTEWVIGLYYDLQ